MALSLKVHHLARFKDIAALLITRCTPMPHLLT
jgi:hypothetical protein